MIKAEKLSAPPPAVGTGGLAPTTSPAAFGSRTVERGESSYPRASGGEGSLLRHGSLGGDKGLFERKVALPATLPPGDLEQLARGVAGSPGLDSDPLAWGGGCKSAKDRRGGVTDVEPTGKDA